MSIKFLVLGGGVIWVFFLGGGSADFIFMGARIFLTNRYRNQIARFGALRERVLVRARKRHINFEHINFLKVGTTLGQPTG